MNFHCIEISTCFLKICHLFVQFLGIGIVEETTYRRTGKELFDLVFVNHFSLHQLYPFLWTSDFDFHADCRPC